MKKFPLIIAVFISCSVGLIGQDNRMNLAYQYFRDQEYDKAAPIFKELYQKSQAPPYLQYYIRCLTETEKFDEAIRELKKAQRETRELTLNIEIGYVYEKMGNRDESIRYYELPFRNLPTNPIIIKNLGNTYMSYLKYQYAENLYQIGRKLLGNPGEFCMELGNVYATQRKYPEMIEEYYNLLTQDPKYVVSVQHLLDNALMTDIDGNLLSLIKEKTFQYIQLLPGLPVYTEMLIWVLTEEKNFNEAVNLTIALDKRLRESGERVMNLARFARESGAYEPALKAYQYLVAKPPVKPSSIQPGIRNTKTPIERLASIEYLTTRAEHLDHLSTTSENDYLNLRKDIHAAIDSLKSQPEVSQLILPVVRIEYLHLEDYQSALETIDKGLAIQGLPKYTSTLFMLEKGDILLAAGEPWEALFIYARVEKENPDNPEGSEAKMKKARLSYLTGDYQWALMQLDVIKGSTARLVANDAMELSLFIRDNLEKDSANQQLKEIANIDYLIFRHQYDEAMILLDTMLQLYKDSPVHDDCLYRKASILQNRGEYDQAAALLEEIVNRFSTEYLAPKALFELGILYLYKLGETQKAIGCFQQILKDHPTSAYFLDARDHLRELRNKAS